MDILQSVIFKLQLNLHISFCTFIPDILCYPSHNFSNNFLNLPPGKMLSEIHCLLLRVHLFYVRPRYRVIIFDGALRTSTMKLPTVERGGSAKAQPRMFAVDRIFAEAALPASDEHPEPRVYIYVCIYVCMCVCMCVCVCTYVVCVCAKGLVLDHGKHTRAEGLHVSESPGCSEGLKYASSSLDRNKHSCPKALWPRSGFSLCARERTLRTPKVFLSVYLSFPRTNRSDSSSSPRRESHQETNMTCPRSAQGPLARISLYT